MMTVGNTKFIDSVIICRCDYLICPSFGLKDILSKGVFLHLFNIKSNQTYIDLILDARYYSKPEKRERFTKWHEEMLRSNFIFNFQLEIVKYC